MLKKIAHAESSQSTKYFILRKQWNSRRINLNAELCARVTAADNSERNTNDAFSVYYASM